MVHLLQTDAIRMIYCHLVGRMPHQAKGIACLAQKMHAAAADCIAGTLYAYAEAIVDVQVQTRDAELQVTKVSRMCWKLTLLP